jgi:glutamine amidotransferase PdxT
MQGPKVGVLALQGAFEEHQKCLEAVGCRTVQVRKGADLPGSSDVPKVVLTSMFI